MLSIKLASFMNVVLERIILPINRKRMHGSAKLLSRGMLRLSNTWGSLLNRAQKRVKLPNGITRLPRMDMKKHAFPWARHSCMAVAIT